jgi:glutamyl-tRNA reductase
MNLIVVGLNHRTAPVEVREKLSVAPGALARVMEGVRGFADEAVVVSTCNRVEIYARKDGGAIGVEAVRRFFAGMGGVAEKDLKGALYEFRDGEAVKHLFEVAAGLDSMVPGETQVLAQVKEAYMRASEAGMTGGFLNPLFQAAFHEAKRIHTETEVGRRKVSVGSVAVELAEKVLGGLAGKGVLVLGAGKMGELTLRHLAAAGAGSIVVANRTHAAAAELAEKFKGRAVAFTALDESLRSADIVVASSGAPHYLVFADNLGPIMAGRGGRPLFFIDISVPRNVEPEVKKIAGVHLYDIDDLQGVVEKNLGKRKEEVARCRGMVDAAARKYWDGARG